MFTFTETKCDSLRAAGADQLLPFVDTFGVSKNGAIHLDKNCVKGPLQVQKFLDVLFAPECAYCLKSTNAQPFVTLRSALEGFSQVLFSLELVESIVSSIDLQTSGYDAKDFGYALSAARRKIPSSLASAVVPETLTPLAKNIEERAIVAEKILSSFLRSDSGRKMIESLDRSYFYDNEWDLPNNALLLIKSTATSYVLAVAEGYGREVAFDKVILQVSNHKMAYMAPRSDSSPLFLGEDVPLEVLRTMAALWDPESSGALSDANKALTAAWALTPKQNIESV